MTIMAKNISIGRFPSSSFSNTETIRVDSEQTVLPARPSQHHLISLSALDLPLILIHYDQKGLLYEMPASSFPSALKLMQESLSQVLVNFYPLAGRLITSPSDGTIHIDCNDTGAIFIEASAERVHVADVKAAEVTPIVEQMFPLNGAVNIEGHRLPLLAVQVTKLSDGIFLGCSFNHALVDGFSLWHFLSSWAELCRGATRSISVNPSLDRRALGVQSSVRLNIDPNADYKTFSPPPMRIKMFHFSKAVIKGLKDRANHQESQVPQISSLQALCAHVWQGITRARRLSPFDSTSFVLSVDCRSRVVPPLPPSYFGNAIQSIKVTTAASDLASGGVSIPAHLLRSIIQGHKHISIKESMDGWEKNPTFMRLENVANTENIVFLGSSPRFPMYETDFGMGRPVAVRSGCAHKSDGKVNVYPGKEEVGSVDLEICLIPDTMVALEVDELFLNPLV